MAETAKNSEKAKKEKTFQFRIETNSDSEHKSVNDRTEALSIIADLQTRNVSPILLHDDKEQKTICYEKGRYEQNYRVKGGEYAPPQTQKAETTEVAAGEN
ncbi:MAG: hypothetical protein V4670_12200 [Bacteroidota bacterium]